MKTLFALLAAVGLAPPPPATLAFTASRLGALEPCTCTLLPNGGVKREKKLLARAASGKGALLAFSAGTTFYDPASVHTNTWLSGNGGPGVPPLSARADELVDAMNDVATVAFSPASHDIALGIATMRRLAKRSRFPWVLSNVVERDSRRPVFEPLVVVSRGASTYGVVGLAGSLPAAVPESRSFETLPAAETLSRLVEANPQVTQWIVLSTIEKDSDWESVLAVPARKIVLDASTLRRDDRWSALPTDTVVVRPVLFGRSVSFVDLGETPPAARDVPLGTDLD